MTNIEKIIFLLKSEMKEPAPYGLFHLLCLFLMLIIIFILYKFKKNYSDKQLKIALGVYGITALILEILKQISWSIDYDILTKTITWDYQWYAFPFQLCTTPIFISIICMFMKKNKIRNSLLSYISYITILGSISTMLLPSSCFVEDILVNIHTMWLHLGSFVISIYLMMTGEVKINIKSLISAIKVFLIFVFLAQSLNIIIYNLGILNGETFNMFYISPYFISTLPVFNIIQESVPFMLYLLIYIIVICLGSLIIYSIFLLVKYLRGLHERRN